jgi:hypothetical protein
VLAAFTVMFVVGVGALAVDLGMLYKARADALYAAEAGALAGASAFMDFADPFSSAARQEAADRAREYAMRNVILNSPIAPSEVGTPESPGEGGPGGHRNLVRPTPGRAVGAGVRRGRGGRGGGGRGGVRLADHAARQLG